MKKIKVPVDALRIGVILSIGIFFGMVITILVGCAV